MKNSIRRQKILAKPSSLSKMSLKAPLNLIEWMIKIIPIKNNLKDRLQIIPLIIWNNN